MLIQTDRAELGDTRLNPEESVIRTREELLSQEAKKKYWKQEELEDVERSLGPRINWTDLIRRLQKLNPGIQVKDGLKDDKGISSVALYIRKKASEYTSEEKIMLELGQAASNTLGYDYPPNGVFFLDHRYIGGFPKHEMPEWAHVLTDNTKVAVRERRGWRSVLIKLIQSGVITYSQAIKEFGDPSHDRRATFWNDALQKYRRSN